MSEVASNNDDLALLAELEQQVNPIDDIDKEFLKR